MVYAHAYAIELTRRVREKTGWNLFNATNYVREHSFDEIAEVVGGLPDSLREAAKPEPQYIIEQPDTPITNQELIDYLVTLPRDAPCFAQGKDSLFAIGLPVFLPKTHCIVFD